MATAESVVAAMARRVGLVESPPGSNCNELTAWYGMGCVPWCAIGVSRALVDGGFSDDGVTCNLRRRGIVQTTTKGWAYVAYLEDAFRRAGRVVAEPARGDIVTFHFGGGHVGLVEAVNADGSIATIEANYRDSLTRVRRARSVVGAFCRPPYDEAPPAPVVPLPPPRPGAPRWPGRILRYPPLMRGADVRTWQNQMARRGERITVDGKYGRQSRGVCLALQHRVFPNPADHDGEVGPKTWEVSWR